MRRPVKSFKGNDRAMIRKLKASLEGISGVDQRRSTKAAFHDYEATLFAKTTTLGNKVRDLIARCDEALTQVD